MCNDKIKAVNIFVISNILCEHLKFSLLAILKYMLSGTIVTLLGYSTLEIIPLIHL